MHKAFTVLLFLLSGSAFAQEKDVVMVNYGVSKLKYSDTSASAKQLDVKFRLPVYQEGKSVIAATAGYKYLSLSNFPDTYISDLHGLILQVVWLYRFTGKKSMALFAQTGVLSDLKDVSGKDFRYTVGLRYRYKHSDKLSTGWGLAYSRQFFGNQIIPFIDVDYSPNDKWGITGQFPIKPKVLYHFNQKLSAGIEINGEASSYRLSATPKNNQFIQINQWTGLGKLEYQFAKAWQFNLGIGRNFKQSFKLYNDTSTTPWTIITIPIGEKPAPIQKIESRGLNIQLGISFNPFST